MSTAKIAWELTVPYILEGRRVLSCLYTRATFSKSVEWTKHYIGAAILCDICLHEDFFLSLCTEDKRDSRTYDVITFGAEQVNIFVRFFFSIQMFYSIKKKLYTVFSGSWRII